MQIETVREATGIVTRMARRLLDDDMRADLQKLVDAYAQDNDIKAFRAGIERMKATFEPMLGVVHG
jgi:hypothetical protein